MTGIHVYDTYGPLFGVDQMCDASLADQVRIGETVFLETDGDSMPFTVALLETYLDENGQASAVTGVGLNGCDADFVMPGDTLTQKSGKAAVDVPVTTQRVSVDERLAIEVTRPVHTA